MEKGEAVRIDSSTSAIQQQQHQRQVQPQLDMQELRRRRQDREIVERKRALVLLTQHDIYGDDKDTHATLHT